MNLKRFMIRQRKLYFNIDYLFRIMFKKYNKLDEEVISDKIGYPYSVIQKGYPNKISKKKIEKTIDKLLHHMKANAGLDNTKDFNFINIGLAEINNRANRKQFRTAIVISLLSFFISVFSLMLNCN